MRTLFNHIWQIILLCSLVSGCSSVTKVTADENSVSIAVADIEDFGKAMTAASHEAEKHCAKYKKKAKLERTEQAGQQSDASMAYFNCQ